MLKILIADDNALFRERVRAILRLAPAASLVTEATDGDEAVALGLAGTWDIAVLDISMPGQSGLQVLRTLKAKKPALPVLMLSDHNGTDYVQGSFKQGARGYLSKESAPDELNLAIQAVLAGQLYLGRCFRVPVG
jgi:two-component system, NarL family, invasion response regulator UvrY